MTNNQSPSEPDFKRQIPDGDELERLVCVQCGHIQYENPKITVGAVVVRGDRILLCKRAIEPRIGSWTLPAGYLELGETIEEGARREAREEACADITIDRLLAAYSITRLSHVQLFFRAMLTSEDVRPGPESQDARLFKWTEIPWADLAFPSVHWALNHYQASKGESDFAPFTNPPGETGDRFPSPGPDVSG